MNRLLPILGGLLVATALFATGSSQAAVYTSDLVPGFCMDVNMQTKTLDLWNCHGGANQDFQQARSGQVKNQDLCLDTAQSPEGNTLVMAQCKLYKGQRWNFDRKKRQFKNDQGYCVDISGSQKDRGTALIAWKCGSQPNQKWLEGKVIGMSSLPSTGISSDQQQTLVNADQAITSAGGSLAAATGGNQVSLGSNKLIASGDGKFVQTRAR